MANTFHLRILAPDRPFYEGQCQSIVVSSTEGRYGVLAHHSNCIIGLVPGEIKFTLADGTERFAAMASGIMEIEDNKVLILTDTVELPEEIDANRALREMEEAKEEMLQKKSFRDYKLAQGRMIRAMNRLKVKNHGK